MLLCASIVATAGLNGCGSLLFSQDQKPEGTAIQMCRSWREIGVRKGDKFTTETARDILANNEARPEWCGKLAEAKR